MGVFDDADMAPTAQAMTAVAELEKKLAATAK
jgi:hypothetical protein